MIAVYKKTVALEEVERQGRGEYASTVVVDDDLSVGLTLRAGAIAVRQYVSIPRLRRAGALRAASWGDRGSFFLVRALRLWGAVLVLDLRN